MKNRNWLVVLSVVLFAGSGCGIPEEQYNADIARLQKDVDDTRADKDDLMNRVSGLKAEREGLVAELEELQRQLDSLAQERDANAAMIAKARERMEMFRQMLLSFKEMTNAGKIRIKVVNNMMMVEMASEILFPSGSARLSKDGKEAIREVAEVLANIENRRFQVVGHTDNVAIRNARFKSNWELSAMRAVSVVQHMIENGMPADSISAAGFGETQPAMSNETADGRAANRRIEIVLQPNYDELPDLSNLEEMVK